MDFEERLQRAIQRGEEKKSERLREEAMAKLTEEEFRSLHAQARAELSDYIEACLQQLATQFRGFQFQTVATPEGYGARVSRDDWVKTPQGLRERKYSHLEIIIRSYSPSRILELMARGSICNKETLQRTSFQFLHQLDLDSLKHQIDHWVLEYAERFAATV